jgi:hypothetical protein
LQLQQAMTSFSGDLPTDDLPSALLPVPVNDQTSTTVHSVVHSVHLGHRDVSVSFAFCPDDNGADTTFIRCNHWMTLSALLPESFPVPPIKKTFQLGDGRLGTISIELDITITGLTGTAVVRNHRCYVLDIDLPEVIPGKPFLKSLGIDFDPLLLEVLSHHTIHDAASSSIRSPPSVQIVYKLRLPMNCPILLAWSAQCL